jgi:hypothetical protein
MIRKYRGVVSTNRVGSECDFEFEIDDEDLPEDPGKRERMINEIALEALWGSGQIDWDYEEVDSDNSDE